MKQRKMVPNISDKQRLIRIILACIILVIGWYYDSFWGAIAGVLLLITGIFGVCPPCYLKTFGRSIPQICDKK